MKYIAFIAILIVVIGLILLNSESHFVREQLDSTEPMVKETKIDHKYKKVTTTVFWVGESADESNDFISNHSSAWIQDWIGKYGGVDEPYNRCGYKPCGFEPGENPFYFALPYNDINEKGIIKESTKLIPWYKEGDKPSIIKNKWIEIRYNGIYCYAQWEDVGPNESDDFDYIFDNSLPKNTFGAKAGLDISPALRDCLEHKNNEPVEWRFVEFSEVPYGPWKEIITI